MNILGEFSKQKGTRRILNARSKNISFRGIGSKYYMVWVFSRIIDRDQSFISGCVDIPLFLMIVIGKGCVRNRVNKESIGISRYITQKNRHNTPSRLELRKLCPSCYKHTIHGEIKK
ncbi:hypothetical protein G4B88_004372 [Cannabis sativa]|uniref:50S ribosomal protein L33, chloroplastic n=1 Tax=Cannabis sativa TaxID=3483 RepID=A0A7J6I153_CANSA|nr:hypothetical protein G4B88_004372 [Cannabis sativa]